MQVIRYSTLFPSPIIDGLESNYCPGVGGGAVRRWGGGAVGRGRKSPWATKWDQWDVIVETRSAEVLGPKLCSSCGRCQENSSVISTEMCWKSLQTFLTKSLFPAVLHSYKNGLSGPVSVLLDQKRINFPSKNQPCHSAKYANLIKTNIERYFDRKKLIQITQH